MAAVTGGMTDEPAICGASTDTKVRLPLGEELHGALQVGALDPARVTELDEDGQRREQLGVALDRSEIALALLAILGGEPRRVLHEHAAHLARLDERFDRLEEQLEVACCDHALLGHAHAPA